MNKQHHIQQLALCLLYCFPLYFFIHPLLRFLLFVLGVLLGISLLIIDEKLGFQFYQDQPKKLSELGNDLQDAVLKKDESFEKKQDETKFLVSRSTTFLILLVPLSIFVVSSTGSALGSGFVLGMILGLIQEMWLLRKSLADFKHRFLSQLKKDLEASQIELIVLGAIGFFLLLNIWTVLIR